MNPKQHSEQILDSIRKVAFYVGHGKYNDYMSLEEITVLKQKFEKILEIEHKLNQAKDDYEFEEILKTLKKYETFSVKDFIEYKI